MAEVEVPATTESETNEQKSPQPSRTEDLAPNAESKNEGDRKSADDQPQDLAQAIKRQESESARLQEAKKWNDRKRQGNGNRGRGDRNHRSGRYDNNRHDRSYLKSKPNSKFDPTSLPETDDPHAIRKQVEFYFSDSNLLTDKFLFTRIDGHKNLPVPLEVIHSFKRMQRFQPTSAVVSALKDSKTLNLVNDDKDIQRKEALPEGLEGKEIDEIKKVHEDESMARSIYAKGFGEEEASTQFDIEAFFANYGTTNSVRLRRGENKGFKGSVFVEFDSEQTAKDFTAADPPPSYRGKVLLTKSKKQYCDDKVEDIKAGRVRPKSPDGKSWRGDPSHDRSNHGNRDMQKHDDRDWRLRRHLDAEDGFPNNGRKDGGQRERGKHRGFGRGGGRGGRGSFRDRNEERKRQEERSASTEDAEKGSEPVVTAANEISQTENNELGDSKTKSEAEVGAGMEPKDSTPHDVSMSTEALKKRGREEEDVVEDARETKKVDTGNGES